MSKMLSDEYRAILTETHSKCPRWGTSARKHIKNVEMAMRAVDAVTVLDYGCGKGELGQCLSRSPVGDNIVLFEYDPGIPERSERPAGSYDLVVCLDVMEHIEEEHLPAVMDHLHSLVGKVGIFLISTRTASAVLSDGRNAHLLVRNAGWWSRLFYKKFERINAKIIPNRDEVWIVVAAEDYEGDIGIG